VILSLFVSASPISSIVQALPIVAIFAIFYFLLFLPMQRQKKQTAQMLQNLKKGDIVVTSGGLVGEIVVVVNGDDTIVIKVKPDNIKLQMTRNAVASLQKTETSST
jgi:preprotein translocase subunit YajC